MEQGAVRLVATTLEYADEILYGLRAMMKAVDAPEGVILIEDNKPDAIKILERIAEKDDPDDVIKVMPLRSKYPQGAEKMMILSATGRRVPPGKLPSDVGCVVMNVTSAAFISRYLKSGKPLVSRSLTVDGSSDRHRDRLHHQGVRRLPRAPG